MAVGRIVPLLLVGGLLAAVAGVARGDDKDLSLLHYNAAVRHAQRGDHRLAAQEFEAAYRASPQPNFLFNAAQSHRALGEKGSNEDLREALDLYRRFLLSRPDAVNRSKIEHTMAAIEAKIGRQKVSEEDEAARRHYEEGAHAYLAGDYARALSSFTAGTKARPRTDLDFSVARCHDRLGHTREAIDGYVRFVDAAVPERDGPEIIEANRRIDLLRAQLAAKEQPRPSPPSPAPASSSRPLLVSAAVGLPLALGAIGAGLGLFFWAKADHDAWLDGPQRCAPACDPAAVDGAKSREVVGFALIGAGAALAVVDAVLWGLWAKRRPPAKSARVLPSLGGLLVGGEF